MPRESVEQDFSLAGKVISVTGSASGIGRATALLLYHRGATVAVSDINPQALAELEKVLSSQPAREAQQYSSTVVDVAQTVQVLAWVAGIVSQFGRLDCAVNVAGTGDGAFCKIVDKTAANFEKTIGANLSGIWGCMRAQLHHMHRGSSIVNVTSGAGVIGVPGVGLYSAANAGANTLTATAAKEYGPAGIRVNAVAPGVTLTPSMLGTGRAYLEPTIATTPLRRGADPMEIARPIAFLLSDEASFITGVVLRCDGGAAAMGH